MGPLLAGAITGGIGGALNFLGTKIGKYKVAPQYTDRLGPNATRDGLNQVRDLLSGAMAMKSPIDYSLWQALGNPDRSKAVQAGKAGKLTAQTLASRNNLGVRSGSFHDALARVMTGQMGDEAKVTGDRASEFAKMLLQRKYGAAAMLGDMAMNEQENKIGGAAAAYNPNGGGTQWGSVLGAGLFGLLGNMGQRGTNTSGGAYYQSGPRGPGSYDYDAERGVAGY